MRGFTLTAIALIAPAIVSDAKESAQQTLDAALLPMIEAHEGEVAAAFEHLETGERWEYQAEKRMPSASLIKLPVMAATYVASLHGDLSLDDPVTLTDDDKVPGSGLLTKHFSDGAQLSLRDAVRLMIGWSDNTATNLVIEALGRTTDAAGDTPAERGINATNRLMSRIGCNNLRLNSLVWRRDTSVDAERSGEFGLGVMTPDETLQLLVTLMTAAPAEFDLDEVEAARREMFDHLRACQSETMAPALLPEGTVVAHKTGGVERSRCDAGVIESPTGPIAFCVMTAKNADPSWADEAPSHKLVAQIVKAAYDYYVEGPGAVDAPRVARVLRMGQDDPLVVPVQRTLNARLKPSPELGVDGDFGPNTRKAVIAFQEQEKIEVTGEVDGPTWNALGPLIMDDEPVPTPEEALEELDPLLPQDTPWDRPIVACRAWAIADGETGKLLWGYNDAAVRDPASVTKSMTAHLVCRLADEDPAVLEEVITFSERADKTSGSTADVRAGELVTAGELLYGLMLPSGNDASVAFAEHFGDRFPGEDGDSAYDRFIAAMNAEAARLGMNETGYRNPHGLTAKGHVTSARDMVKLAHAAMQNETFRKVVATRRHVTTVGSVAGYKRRIVWDNTDRMLNYEGFYGVKTGTTGPAGACLVSAGERGGDPSTSCCSVPTAALATSTLATCIAGPGTNSESNEPPNRRHPDGHLGDSRRRARADRRFGSGA